MSGRGARRADGVTRDMINTRRLEVLEQIKQLEEKLNKERRAKKRGAELPAPRSSRALGRARGRAWPRPLHRDRCALFVCCDLRIDVCCSTDPLLTLAARSKSTRLRSKLLGAGSSLVASNMTVSTARSDRSFRPPASPMEFKSAAYYARVGRQGKTMARLLDSTQCGADVKEVGELSTSKRTHQFRPESGASCCERRAASWGRYPRGVHWLTRCRP